MRDATFKPSLGRLAVHATLWGAVALYLQAHPKATFDQVLKALEQSGTQYAKPDDELGYGRVQVDKLITKDTISPDAKLTDASRVQHLMDLFGKSQDWQDPPKATDPATPTPAPATGGAAAGSAAR